MAIIFCLNSIPQREENLKKIVPTILNQADKFYVNLVNYDHTPNIFTGNPKFVISHFKKAGAEYKFLHYNNINDHDYYFTIDDDILYPYDYARKMIKAMQGLKNKAICCVHGTLLDLSLNGNYYKKGKRAYNYKKGLNKNVKVLLPGTGTSCIYKGTGLKFSMEDFKTPNMADPYIASFAHKQGIPVYAIKREKGWLKMLPQKKSIWGNNPYKEIDKLIRETFK